jgi:hypothetical protein
LGFIFAKLQYLKCDVYGVFKRGFDGPIRFFGLVGCLEDVSLGAEQAAEKLGISCEMKGRRPSGAKQAAEKELSWIRMFENKLAGAKAHVDIAEFAARLKSCPVSKPLRIAFERSFSRSL